jgi:prevent-host-death family protein
MEDVDGKGVCYYGHKVMVMKKLSRARETPPEYGSPDEPVPVSHEIGAGQFKARCLSLMNDVQERGSEYVITKRGVPVARLVPVRTVRRSFIGSMKGTTKTLGDMISPLDEPWDALGGADDER